jgi:hypothetical protein
VGRRYADVIDRASAEAWIRAQAVRGSIDA